MLPIETWIASTPASSAHFATLNSLFQRVAFLFPRIERVAEIHRIQLRLKMIVAPHFFPNRLNNLDQGKPPGSAGLPPY